MPTPITCSARTVEAADGSSIPVPVGGLGLPDGNETTIKDDAEVQISLSTDADGHTIGYYVVVNNSHDENSEASHLFGDLAQETAIAQLEHIASEAFTTVAPFAFKAAGLVVGVLATLLSSSALTREVFIRSELDTGMATDGPPITYCLLLPE